MAGLLDSIDALCDVPRRAPCSDAERRAAIGLRRELERRGHEAWAEPVWTRPQWPTALLAHALLAVAGSVVSVSAPAVGLGLALAAALGLALEAGGRLSPVRLPFRRRATQMVVTEPEDPEAIALVLVAGYDAPRRGLIFRDALRRLAARGRGPGRPRAVGWLALAALAIAAAAGARLGGVEANWLGIAQFVPTVVLLLALAAAADIALSDVSPGASDPASGVAVALAALDDLVDDPPAELSASVLLAGASETVPPDAVRRYLRAERLDPARAVVIEVGPCGAGDPVLITGHPQLRAAAAAAPLPLAPGRRPLG
ncbi:MAG TPA: hypothetical protein VF533_16475, partial [Solirubrobacteraceae bacterium]